MGAIGATIFIEPNHELSEDDKVKLADQLWQEILTGLGQTLGEAFTHGIKYPEMLHYLGGPVLRYEDRSVTFANTEISFWFPDHAGCSSLESGLAEHWFALMIRVRRARLRSLLASYGVEMKLPEPSVRELLEDSNELFVEFGSDIYAISDAEEIEKYYGGDIEKMPIRSFDDENSWGELSDGQQRMVRAIIRSNQCECPVCKRGRRMARPDSNRPAMLENRRGWWSRLLSRLSF